MTTTPPITRTQILAEGKLRRRRRTKLYGVAISLVATILVAAVASACFKQDFAYTFHVTVLSYVFLFTSWSLWKDIRKAQRAH